jgi:hypothetical protein
MEALEKMTDMERNALEAPAGAEEASEPEAQPAATPQQVSLSPSEAAMYHNIMAELANVKQLLQVVIAGHQVTHRGLGAKIQSDVSGEPIKMPKEVWEALGVKLPKPGEIVIARATH